MKRPLRSIGLIVLTTLGILGAHSTASAHSFWIQADRDRYEAGQTAYLTLLVGHGAERQISRIPSRRVVRFDVTKPDGSVESLISRDGGLRNDRVPVRLDQTGTYMITFVSDDLAQSHLPADRFNQHLAIEGLTPAQSVRQQTNTTERPGSEAYGRRARAILLVHGAGFDSPQPLRPAGLTLEIVPALHPSSLEPGKTLPVQILYDGRPLPGALVKLVDLSEDELPTSSLRTDGSGRASFVLPRRGHWLVTVTWTRPNPTTEETDFQTVFSALSFANR